MTINIPKPVMLIVVFVLFVLMPGLSYSDCGCNRIITDNIINTTSLNKTIKVKVSCNNSLWQVDVYKGNLKKGTVSTAGDMDFGYWEGTCKDHSNECKKINLFYGNVNKAANTILNICK